MAPNKGSSVHGRRCRKASRTNNGRQRRQHSSSDSSADKNTDNENVPIRRGARQRLPTSKAVETTLFSSDINEGRGSRASAEDALQWHESDDDDDFRLHSKKSNNKSQTSAAASTKKKLDDLTLKVTADISKWSKPPALNALSKLMEQNDADRQSPLPVTPDIHDIDSSPSCSPVDPIADDGRLDFSIVSADVANAAIAANEGSSSTKSAANDNGGGGDPPERKSGDEVNPTGRAASSSNASARNVSANTGTSTSSANVGSGSSEHDDELLLQAEKFGPGDVTEKDGSHSATMLLLSDSGAVYGICIPAMENLSFRGWKHGKLVHKDLDDFLLSQFSEDLKYFEIKGEKGVLAKAAVVGCCPYGFQQEALENLQDDLQGYPARKSTLNKINTWSKYIVERRNKIADDPTHSYLAAMDKITLPSNEWRIKGARGRISGIALDDTAPRGLDLPFYFDKNTTYKYGTRSSGDNVAKYKNWQDNLAMIDNGPKNCGEIMAKYWKGGRMYDYGSLEQHEEEPAGRNRIRIDDRSEDNNAGAVYVDNDAFCDLLERVMRRQFLDGGQVVVGVRGVVDLCYPPITIPFFRASTAHHGNAAQELMEAKVVAAIKYQANRIIDHVNAKRLLAGSKITIAIPENVVETMVNEYTRSKRVMFQQSRFASSYQDKFTYSETPRQKKLEDVKLLAVTEKDIGKDRFQQFRGGQANGFAVRVLTAKMFIASGVVKDENWHTALGPVLRASDAFRNFNATASTKSGGGSVESDVLSNAKVAEAQQQRQRAGTSANYGSRASGGAGATGRDDGGGSMFPPEKLVVLQEEAFEMGCADLEEAEFDGWVESLPEEFKGKSWVVSCLRRKYRTGFNLGKKRV